MRGFIFAMFMCFVGCGEVEKTYDSANYESISNEKVDIAVYSGGAVVRVFNNATVIYADSDSGTMLIRDENGKEVYIQGDLIADIKE